VSSNLTASATAPLRHDPLELLILTAMRTNAILDAQWTDLIPTVRFRTALADRTKGNKEHRVRSRLLQSQC
jgi:hypothetical protein